MWMFSTVSVIATLASPSGELPFQPVANGGACLRDGGGG
jgi:hypothetical protein